MASTKQKIREAEEKIENILDALESSCNVRAFRIAIVSTRGEQAEITITPDDKGGRY